MMIFLKLVGDVIVEVSQLVIARRQISKFVILAQNDKTQTVNVG